MKFSANQVDLLNILQLGSSVIERRSTVPVLSHLYLRSSSKTSVECAVTDLEVFLTTSVPCSVEVEGQITIPLKQLYDIVRELSPDQIITIEIKENNWIHITSGHVFFQLVGLPGKDFPTIPSIEAVKFDEMDPEVLLEMIDKTQFSISTDETRYHLNGVYFTRSSLNGSRTLRMVSTDGHRLSLIDRSIASELGSLDRGVIIPRKGLHEIRKLLVDVKGPLLVGIDENRAVIRRGPVMLQIRLIEGEFPDCQKVIPKQNDRRVKLSRDLFLSSLKRISLLSNDSSKTVTFSFRPGWLELRSTNPNVGEAKEDLEVSYEGEAFKIGFNARYFIDVLSQLSTDEVELELKDKLSPGVLKNPKDECYTAVVMPMRI